MNTEKNESGLWTPAEPAKAPWEIKPYKFGIMIDKIGEDQWSFGINFSRDDKELYVYINFYKWNIVIGKLNTYDLCFHNEENS